MINDGLNRIFRHAQPGTIDRNSGNNGIDTLFLEKTRHALSIDQETRVLNDFEKFHNMAMLAMEDPSIIRVMDNRQHIVDYPNKMEVAFSFYVLWS